MKKKSDIERKVDEAILFSKQQTEEILQSTDPLPFALSSPSRPGARTADSITYILDRQSLRLSPEDTRVLSAIAKSALYARLAQREITRKIPPPPQLE